MTLLHDKRQVPDAAAPADARPGLRWRPSALLGAGVLVALLASGPLPLAVPGQAVRAYLGAAGLGVAALLVLLIAAETARSRALRGAGLAGGTVEVAALGPRLVGAGVPATPDALRSTARASLLTLVGGALLLAGVGWAASLVAGPAAHLLSAAGLWTGAAAGLLVLTQLVPAPANAAGALLVARYWRRTGSHERALLLASRAGVRSGGVLLGLGLVATLFLGMIGLWVSLLGGLVLASSAATRASTGLRMAISGIPAAEVMAPLPPQLPAWTSVEDGWREAMSRRSELLLLFGPDARPVGVVRVAALGAVPADDRGLTRLSQLMIPVEAVPTIAVYERLEAALDRMAAAPAAGLVFVVAGDEDSGPEPVGVLTPADLSRVALLRGQPTR